MKQPLILIKWVLSIVGILAIMYSAVYNSQLAFCIGVILELLAVITFLYIDLQYNKCSPTGSSYLDEQWIPDEEEEDGEPLSDTMTNSEITAACIKAGITDEADIKWVQDAKYLTRGANWTTQDAVNDHIQYLLTQKEQSKSE